MPLTWGIAICLVTGICSYLLGWYGHKEKIKNVVKHMDPNTPVLRLKRWL